MNITTNSFNLTVFSLFSPPKHNIKAERYIEILNSLKSQEIDLLFGVTAMQKTHQATTKRKEFLKALNKYKWGTVSTGKHTYWAINPVKTLELTDFYVIINIVFICKQRTT